MRRLLSHCAKSRTQLVRTNLIAPHRPALLSTFNAQLSNSSSLHSLPRRSFHCSAPLTARKSASPHETESEEALAAAASGYFNRPSATTDGSVDPAAFIEQMEAAVFNLTNQLHAMRLWTHFEDKLRQRPLSDTAMAIYEDVLNRMDIHYCDIQQFSGDLIVERVHKEFSIAVPEHDDDSYPIDEEGLAGPSNAEIMAAAATGDQDIAKLENAVKEASEALRRQDERESAAKAESTESAAKPAGPELEDTEEPGAISFSVEWQTERNKVKNMGVFNSRAAIYVTMPDHDEPHLLLEVDDTRLHTFDKELFHTIKKDLECGELSDKEFQWLITVLATYPSDLAFDVVSQAFAGQK